MKSESVIIEKLMVITAELVLKQQKCDTYCTMSVNPDTQQMRDTALEELTSSIIRLEAQRDFILWLFEKEEQCQK